MRVISGRLKGRPLLAPKGHSIRPTSDQAKETLFNMLGPDVHQATMLDLFAGTGALGIEALSRGAESVVFADVDNDSISVLKENIKSLSLESRTKIIRWDLTRNLNCLGSWRSAFNLIFMDPPYNKNIIEPTLLNLHSGQSMEKGARIIVEHSYLEPILKRQLPLKISDQRRYGKTLVSFLTYVV